MEIDQAPLGPGPPPRAADASPFSLRASPDSIRPSIPQIPLPKVAAEVKRRAGPTAVLLMPRAEPEDAESLGITQALVEANFQLEDEEKVRHM